MINHFTFNGTSTAQLGLIVSGVSIFGAGSRKVEKAGIPGRNGDLQIELGGFNNYTVRYTVSIPKNFTTTAQQIREWLLESKGYCDLTDTYHPDEIRKACFNSDIEFTTSMLYKYGQASIQFDCLPERYLTTNTPITTTATADTTTDTTMSLNTVPTPITISLNGNTTQEGSSGKNVFDYKYWVDNITVIRGTKTVNGNSITITATDTDSYTNYRGTYEVLFPKVTTNTDYTLSWDRDSGSARGLVYIFDEGGSAITSAQSTAKKVTFNSGSNTFIQFRFGVQASGNSITYSNIMLEKGSTATAYEPHISPTNPQPIHNVLGDNEVKVLGKNLFEPTLISNGTNITHSSATTDVQVGADGTFTWKSNGTDMYIGQVGSAGTNYQNTFGILIPILPNTNYVLSDTSEYGANYITWYDINKKSLGYVGAFVPVSAKRSPANARYASIRFGYNQGVSGQTYSTRIQFEQANAKTDFEPYTRQSYTLYLPVENLLDSDLLLEASGWTETDGVYSGLNSTLHAKWGTNTDGIYNTFEQGQQYTFSFDLRQDSTGFGALVIRFYYTDNTYDGKQIDGTSEWKRYTFTSTSTTKTLSKLILSYGNTLTIQLKNIQLEKGAKENAYHPYGTTPIELNKIGTYQDYIYKNGGKWYVHKAITKVDLGTLTWGYNTSYAHPFFIGTLTQNIVENTNAILSTSYTYITFNEMAVVGHDSGITAPSATQLRVSNYSYTDATAFKNASNGVFAYYPLATRTNTEITDTTLINQLNNIEKAYSYNGTTNILQVSNDNGFMLAVVSLHGSTFNSNYKGEPIITVNSTGLIYLNGEVMEVLSAPVTINCQTMQCYNGVVNMNNEVRVNDFPEIKIGENIVGSSMALTITPNNWRH